MTKKFNEVIPLVKKIRFLFHSIVLLLTVSWNVQGQEVFSNNDVYAEHGVVYKVSDGIKFSGKLQKIRKNGHLVHKAIFEEGYIVSSTLFFKQTKHPIPANTIYYHPKSGIIDKVYDFSRDGTIVEIDHYDTHEQLLLKEIYVSETLTYRCEYQNGKKHGIEFCLDKKGNEITEQYENGRRIQRNPNPKQNMK